MKVELIDHMGNDNSVVNAARVSFAKEASNFTDEQNHRLIRYLAEHNHLSPFYHATITLRMKAPIAIHAQMMKHAVGFAHNSTSRRYVSDAPELFLPTFRTAPDGNVKQGSGGEHDENELLQEVYQSVTQECLETYESMIKNGVAAEQARFVLPQGVLTEWVSTGSLYAWARFYNQRTDPHAQKEIQDLAKMVGEIIEPLYPHSWEALARQSENPNG